LIKRKGEKVKDVDDIGGLRKCKVGASHLHERPRVDREN
jgi:hypothetical protein